jgi:peptidoglycan/LPS O-acetylase OafA/YrhL
MGPKAFRAKYIMLTVIIIGTWLSENYMNYFVAGLMLADMRQEGVLEKFKKNKYRHAIKIGLIIITAPIAFTYFNNPIRTAFSQWLRGNLMIHKSTEPWWPDLTLIFPFIWVGMFIVETTPWLQKVLSWKPFLFLGQISYMLYLSHTMTWHILEPYINFIVENNGERSKIPSWVGNPLSVVILWSCNFLIGWILTKLFDEPSLKILQWAERIYLMEEQWSWKLVKEWGVREWNETVGKCRMGWKRVKGFGRRGKSKKEKKTEGGVSVAEP